MSVFRGKNIGSKCREKSWKIVGIQNLKYQILPQKTSGIIKIKMVENGWFSPKKFVVENGGKIGI